MEMMEDIYANAVVVAENLSDSCDSEHSYEDVYGNEDKMKTQRAESFKQSENSGGVSTSSRCYRLTAVCLLLLCIFLLTGATVMWIKFNNLNTECIQLQTSYDNLTVERNQLQTSYNNLTVERDQLQTSYNTLTVERDQLQRYKEELQKLFKLVGWISFQSSFYYITNGSKSWTESRQDCRERGADLVVINSKEEQDFISKLRANRIAWIGLNDRDREGEWKWVDDTQLTTKYWISSEPNSNGADEDCAITSEGKGGIIPVIIHLFGSVRRECN